MVGRESWNICLKSFLEMIDKLSKIDIRTTAIFMDTVLSTLLIRLRTSSNEDIAEIMQFVTCVSQNNVDFLARDGIKEKTVGNVFFKFSVDSEPSTYDELSMEKSLNHFAQLGYILSTRLKEKPSRYFSTDSVQLTPFWHYCEGLRSFEKNELKTALQHLLKVLPSSLSDYLQCRYHNLLGRVYSAMGERQKALKKFTTALEFDKNFCPAHYYQGREFGKLGLVDLMLKSYQNLVLVSFDKFSCSRKKNFQFISVNKTSKC